MARLTTKARKKIPASKFAGPGRSYPVEDRSHAANAKARATQAVRAGRMPKSEESRIDAKANRVLGESKGSKAGEHERHTARHSSGRDHDMLKHTGAKEREHRGREHLKEHAAKRHEPRRAAREHEHIGEKRRAEHKKEGREHESRGMKAHEHKAEKMHKGGEHHHHHHHIHVHAGK